MNKKYLIAIIVTSLIFLLFYLSNITTSLDYDNYKEMKLHSKESTIELEREGYSDLDVEKIKEFEVNYKNFSALLDIVEDGNLENYGYNNRSLSGEAKSNIVYDENYYTKQDNALSYTTTIMDLVRDNNADRDAGRIIIEFEWDAKPYTQNQYIDVKYHNYILENIYTLLKYKNPNDEKDIIYKMCEIKPYNFIDEFCTDIVCSKTIDQKNYILKSGIIVLDIKSYYQDSIAPLSISSKYVGKSVFGKEEVLSEHEIINAEKIMD